MSLSNYVIINAKVTKYKQSINEYTLTYNTTYV